MKKILLLLNLLGLSSAVGATVVPNVINDTKNKNKKKNVTEEINKYIKLIQSTLQKKVHSYDIQNTVDKVDKGDARDAISNVEAKPLDATPKTASIVISLKPNYTVDKPNSLKFQVKDAVIPDINSAKIKEKIDRAFRDKRDKEGQILPQDAIEIIKSVKGTGFELDNPEINVAGTQYTVTLKPKDGFTIDGKNDAIKIVGDVTIDTNTQLNPIEIQTAIKRIVSNQTPLLTKSEAEDKINNFSETGYKLSGASIDIPTTTYKVLVKATTGFEINKQKEVWITDKIIINTNTQIKLIDIKNEIDKKITKAGENLSEAEAIALINGITGTGWTISGATIASGTYTATATATEGYQIDKKTTETVTGAITINTNTQIKLIDIQQAVDDKITKAGENLSEADAIAFINGITGTGWTISGATIASGTYTATATATEGYQIDYKTTGTVTGAITINSNTQIKLDVIQKAVDDKIKASGGSLSEAEAIALINGITGTGWTIGGAAIANGKYTATATASTGYQIDGKNSVEITGSITIKI